MLYANSPDAQKITATPKAIATCPFCKSNVIPKCGSINIWHWAHESIINCDPWAHKETDWHLNWKSLFPKENTEVLLSLNGKTHIADYFNPISRNTIEFQNGNLSLDNRLERELFYPNLIWIINLKNKDGLDLESECGHVQKYRWKQPVRWFTEYPNKACYYMLDNFPEEKFLFQITKFYHKRGYDHTDFGWKKYHRTYIEGIPWEKDYFVYHTNNNLAWW